MGSFWDSFRVGFGILESISDYFGIILGLYWIHLKINWNYWGLFGIRWDCFRIIFDFLKIIFYFWVIYGFWGNIFLIEFKKLKI